MQDIENLPLDEMECDEPSINISNPVMEAILGKRDNVHVVVDDDKDALGMEEVPDWEDVFH